MVTKVHHNNGEGLSDIMVLTLCDCRSYTIDFVSLYWPIVVSDGSLGTTVGICFSLLFNPPTTFITPSLAPGKNFYCGMSEN